MPGGEKPFPPRASEQRAFLGGKKTGTCEAAFAARLGDAIHGQGELSVGFFSPKIFWKGSFGGGVF